MWIELVSLPHLCHAQLAEVRQNSSGTSTILPVSLGGVPKLLPAESFFPAALKPNEGLTVLKEWPLAGGIVLVLLVQTSMPVLIKS